MQLVARMIQPRYVPHDFVHQDARYDPRSTHARYIIYPLSGIHNFVQQVARYDARMNQPRYVIHDSLVTCILMHERFNLGACLTISCNKLHATIHDFVQQVARYDL